MAHIGIWEALMKNFHLFYARLAVFVFDETLKWQCVRYGIPIRIGQGVNPQKARLSSRGPGFKPKQMFIWSHLRQPSVRFARSHLPLGGFSRVATALQRMIRVTVLYLRHRQPIRVNVTLNKKIALFTKWRDMLSSLRQFSHGRRHYCLSRCLLGGI